MAKVFKGHCRECGEAFTAPKAGKLFCSSPCRQTFNNRRLQRGAELYDMFMAVRYDREAAREQGLWSIMCRMAEQFREEDVTSREGRKSWAPAREVLADRPDLRAVKTNISFKRKG